MSISNISRSFEEFVSHAMNDLSLWNRSTDSSKDSTRRFFLSLSECSRASGIPASGKLSGTLRESTLSDKATGSGGMTVRFPTIRRLTVVGLGFHLDCGSSHVEKSASNQVPQKIRQLVHQKHDGQVQKQGLIWMSTEWECFVTDRQRNHGATVVLKKVP